MASLALSELIPLVRAMADDNDVYLQEYTDEELITNLRIGIMLMEAAWNNGYAVELNDNDPNNIFYEIVGESAPEQWLQILYCLKSIIGMKAYREHYSIDNHVVKITNNDQTESKKTLKEFYDEIIETRKNCGIGYVFTTFDDFFTRYYDIVDAISQGYR